MNSLIRSPLRLGFRTSIIALFVWQSKVRVSGLARKIEFLELNQAVSICPVPFAKIFLFSFDPNHFYIRAVLSFREGRWPSSRTLGRDAMDAAALVTNSAKADGEVVWS